MYLLMTQFKNYLSNLKRNEKGQAMVEYALIIAVVAVLLIGALVVLRKDIAGIFESIGEALADS